MYEIGVAVWQFSLMTYTPNGEWHTANANTTPTVVLTAGIYYAKNFAIVDDTIYFVDYKSQIAGNAHLYQLTMGETEPALIR